MEEVTICIPARNEALVILQTVDTLLAMCNLFPAYSWNVTVVDNGSTDATASLVRSHSDTRVRLLQQPILGKGAAVSFAAKNCTSDFLVFIDADLSADFNQIPLFIETIKKGSDIVIGSRLLNTEIIHRSIWRSATAWIFSTYAQLLVPVSVVDSQCGLKAMNRAGIAILASCGELGWFFDRELLAKAVKRKLKIVELSVAWEEFRYPDRKSKLHVVRAGLQSIVSLWRIRNEVKKF